MSVARGGLGKPPKFTKEKSGPRIGLQACIALADALTRKRDSWTLTQIAGLRWRGADRQRISKRIRNWYEYGARINRSKTPKIYTRGMLHQLAGDQIRRGRLALALEKKVFELCDRSPGGQIVRWDDLRSEFADLDSIKTSDLAALVSSLNKGEPQIDADHWRALAGPTLKSCWVRWFGERRNAPQARSVRPSPNMANGDRVFSAQDPSAIRLARANDDHGARETTPTYSWLPFFARRLLVTNGWKSLIKLTAMLNAGFVTIMALAYVTVDPRLRAYRTFFELGSQEGLTALQFQLKGRESGDYGYYLLAFAQYRAGNIDQAREMAFELMTGEPNAITQSDCRYLLGLIERDSGVVEASTRYMIQALQDLEGLPTDTRRYLINLELAKSHLGLGQIEAGNEYFQTAESIKSRVEAGLLSEYDHIETEGRVRLAVGDVSGALASFKTAEAYIVNKDQRFNHHAWRAWAAWIGGDLEQAANQIDEAEAFVSNSRMRAHLDVVRIAVRRCRNQDDSVLQRRVQSWLTVHPSQSLNLKLTKATSCDPHTP